MLSSLLGNRVSRSGSWCRTRTGKAESRDWPARGPTRCVRHCRNESRGRGRTSRRNPLVGDGNATKMRADADDHQPGFVVGLGAFLIRLRVGQAAQRNGARLLHLLFSAMGDEDRFAARVTLITCPSAIGARSTSIGRARRDGGGVRTHLRDQGHEREPRADRADRAGSMSKIATRGRGFESCVDGHGVSPFL